MQPQNSPSIVLHMVKKNIKILEWWQIIGATNKTESFW